MYRKKSVDMLCVIFPEAWSGTKTTFMIDPIIHVYCLYHFNGLCQLLTVQLTFVVD